MVFWKIRHMHKKRAIEEILIFKIVDMDFEP